LILVAERDARADGKLRADNRLTANQAVLSAIHVHRAALALADAGRLAKEFGHDGLRVHAPDNGLPMLAVAADDVVRRAQGAERADPAGLLPDIEMQEAANLAEGIFLGGF